jgi:cell wall-associated NlpC family hydrolase
MAAFPAYPQRNYMLVNAQYIRNKYLGVPYLHHGRTMAGLDCWGLFLAVYQELGFKLLDIEEDYDADWSWKGKNLFIENYHKEWSKVEQPMVLDGVLFENKSGVACHAGIVIAENEILHTCRQGTVVNRITDLAHKHNIAGYYRLKALQYD